MLFHILDFLHRHKGQHLQALDHVCVVDISPVLVELIGGSLSRIQPYSAFFRLTHFLPLGIEQQGNGHGISVLAQLLADQLRTSQHICPLVISAKLHITAVILEQAVEVVGLHNHVVEFQECESPLHSLLIAFKGQHLVDGEACAHVPEHVHIVEIQQPVCIVYRQRLALGKINEPGHLLLEAFDIVFNGFPGHHLPHIGLAGRISDHAGAASQQNDGLVARHLESLHQAQRHKVAYMQGICGGVKADVEGCFAGVDQFLDLLFIGELCQQPSAFQFFK